MRSHDAESRRPGPAWDVYLRSTLVLGIGGIVLVLAVPAAGALVGFAIYTLWVTGPLSPLFPIGLEPVVMLLGRVHAPLLVAAVVTLAGLHAEFLSYHLYARAFRHRSLRHVRHSRFLVGTERWFRRAPFWTVWFLSWAPLPYWWVRILASLTDYPMTRYLAATFLGRFPKFWLFAALGLQWEVPGGVLVSVVGAGTLVSAMVLLMRRRGGESGVEVGDPQGAGDRRPCGGVPERHGAP